MLFPALIAVFFIFLNLITDIPLKFRVSMRKGFADAKFTVRLFYGLIPVNFFFRLEYQPRAGIKLIRILKNGKTKVSGIPAENRGKKKKQNIKQTGKQSVSRRKSIMLKKMKKALLKAVCGSIAFKRFETSGEIGIRSDPFSTVLLAGFIKIMLDTSVKLFIMNLTGTGKNADLKAGFFPCMTRNTFSLNLEGIASVNKPKLIRKTVCAAAGVLIKFFRQNINRNKGDINKCTLLKT